VTAEICSTMGRVSETDTRLERDLLEVSARLNEACAYARQSHVESFLAQEGAKTTAVRSLLALEWLSKHLALTDSIWFDLAVFGPKTLEEIAKGQAENGYPAALIKRALNDLVRAEVVEAVKRSPVPPLYAAVGAPEVPTRADRDPDILITTQGENDDETV